MALLAVVAIVLAMSFMSAQPASAVGSVGRAEGITLLQDTRRSIDRTLALLKSGDETRAFAEAKSGYLTHFERVEIPLRVADNRLTIETEGKFAEIRQAIRSHDSTESIRTKIIELRGLIDRSERALTDVGVGAPMLIAGQSFIIIFREGFEIVLLLSVLLGYLEAAKSTHYMRPILTGVALAAVATVLTVIVMRTIFARLPVGIEVLEGITALLAVVVLFYVSFWLIARLEHKRWMEFLRAKMWNAVSVGSAGSLVAVGFTAVYREGFETALFYQSLLSFGSGLIWAVLGGLAAGLAALAVVAIGIFRLGRRVNVKVFMNTAVALVMLTSVAFLGNAVHALQSADIVSYHALGGWPRMPIFLAQATGYWTTAETIGAQLALVAVYVLGAAFVFVIRPRRNAARVRRVLGSARAPVSPVVVAASPVVMAGVRRQLAPSMPPSTGTIRVGVDVGGTFTKAVAFDLSTGTIVGEEIVSTTHTAADGVADGVVRCVAALAAKVGAANIGLVTHSTTQAVNALLEGDVGEVGVIGLGRMPELKRAKERTALAGVELAPGKTLRTVPSFFDVTGRLDEAAVTAELDRLVARGAGSVSVAEAFAPDDATNETRVAELAAERGLSACASTELSGLYGLELRAVTAAINASILPIAVRTANVVEQGVRAAGITAPVMVMRGDGGATDLEGFRKAPARTLYSGPAASVAGALRYADVADAIVVEVGGTSTNVAAVHLGRPALSYVQVASHATALRAVDVRVVGVAGGSMLRAHTVRGAAGIGASKLAVYGVGPRSAHIAGYPYACFASPEQLDGAVVELVAPRPGDPQDYVILRLTDGSAVAVTNTCAANALGTVHADDYAYAAPEAARRAFAAVGRWMGIDGDDVARHMLQASSDAVAELIDELIRAQKLRTPTIVAVGGGAGGLGRYVAASLGLECRVPAGAEVISSIGDALSLVRVERERTVGALDSATARALLAEVEAEAVAAGASPGSLDVRLEERPETGTVRAIATGSIGLVAGAIPGRVPAHRDTIDAAARVLGGATARQCGHFWIVAAGDRVHVLDRFGDPTEEVTGIVVEDRQALAGAVAAATRHRGPVTIRPSIWAIRGAAIVEFTSGDIVAAASELIGDDADARFIVGRAR